MGNEMPNIIDEMEFVLSHPSCNVQVLEKFYNNWLFVYDTVPLFTIVDHMRRAKPELLKEWSKVNITVRSLLDEMESKQVLKIEKPTITIHVDLSELSPSPNGIFQIKWETEIEEPIVNAHFKTKSLLVIDKREGKVKLVGISNLDENRYHIYVKKGEEIK